jgi:hypothetical protein
MKIALCFIISYEHILNKETIWREWIDYNKDIINVYFYYKNVEKIKSSWILNHIIPSKYIYETSYYHVVPAYLSIMNYAYSHDYSNQWFCMLTDSCCPIISPKKFRYLFFNNYNYTIMNWRKAWWNIQLIKRANLHLLPPELQLANDPWFIIKREDVSIFFKYKNIKPGVFKTICDGGLANESIFSIILKVFRKINNVKKSITHITDWSRMMSSTSPYLFKEATIQNIQFIEKSLKENPYAIFIRKISPDFPNHTLEKIIYNENNDKDIIIYPYYYYYIMNNTLLIGFTSFFLILFFLFYYRLN